MEDFYELSHCVEFNDVALKDIFCFGLDEPLRSSLPGGKICWSLELYIVFALLLAGSPFTVGIADEEPCYPPVSAEYLHVMSGVVHIMPTVPESVHVMSATPKPAYVMSATPGPAHVTSAKPGPAHITSAKPGPAHAMFAKPGPANVMPATQETRHKIAASPEPLRKMAATPQSIAKMTTMPESRHALTATPEPCNATVDKPESHHATDTMKVLTKDFFLGGRAIVPKLLQMRSLGQD